MEKKVIYMAVAVILIALVASLAFVASGVAAGQEVKNGDNVSVFYTGKFTNGTVFDTNVGGQPLNFTVGANEVIPGFDNAVIGMRVGESKNVTIPPSEAYGEPSANLIVEVPLSSFGNSTVTEGMGVTQTAPNGQQFQGIVTSVNSTTATVDFNPPLAGKTLVFDIKVSSIGK